MEELLHPNTSTDRSDPEFASALGSEYCAPVGEGSLFFDALLSCCVYLPRISHHYIGAALTKVPIPGFQMMTTTSWWRRSPTARWRMTQLTMRQLAQVINVLYFPGSINSEQYNSFIHPYMNSTAFV
jgi:hypothetical protein